MSDALEAIKNRSSARGYSDVKLTDAEINTLVEAGLQAPTATNRKEIRFAVIDGKSDIIAELDKDFKASRSIGESPVNFMYNAPLLIVLSGEDAFGWSKVDAGIAVQSIAVAAEAMGLGNVIIGCIYDVMNGDLKAKYNKAFGIPEGFSFEVAIAVGHKTDAKVPHDYEISEQVTFVK